MTRNIERAENIARFIDVTYNLMLDFPHEAEEHWLPLISTTGDQEWFAEHYGPATRENAIRFLAFDGEYASSILSCVRNARENARSVRETISCEMWEQLNSLYFSVLEASSNQNVISSPRDFLENVKLSSHLFTGITDNTMSHRVGWHFARLGRYLERADKTSRILDVKYLLLLPKVADVGTPVDDLQWSAVLRSVSGFEMYRKRHRGITPERVVGFLTLDRHFPRSIMHCIDEANESLHAITGSPATTFWNEPEKRMGKLRSELAYAAVSDIVSSGLHGFLDSLQEKLNLVGEGIFQQLVSIEPESAATVRQTE